MSEVFTNSGESSNITAGPPPNLQGLFLPGIDNSQFVDGFGIVTPWGGGATSRKYRDYGISTEISNQDTQLRDLASSLIPAGGGGFDFGEIEGEPGPRGFPGRDGIDGIIHIMGLNLPQNSNFVAALPHNLDLINALGTASNKLIYTSAYTAYRNFVWTNSPIAAVSSWNDSDINDDASFLIIAGDAGIYISTDDGDSWGTDTPDDDTYIQTSCASASGEAVVLGNTYRENGTIWVTDDYGVNWTEKTVTV